MSHVTMIQIQEKWELPALKLMCKDMGWTFAESHTKYKAYYDLQDCDHVIRIPGAKFEIGVVREEGEWKLKWDNYYTGGLQRILGKEAGLLKQAYGFAKAKGAARHFGHRHYQRPANRAGWKKLVVEV